MSRSGAQTARELRRERSCELRRERSSSPVNGFDAQEHAWPTLQCVKDAPRRRRRLTWKCTASAGSAVRTATCPPIMRGRSASLGRKSIPTDARRVNTTCFVDDMFGRDAGDESTNREAPASLQYSPRERRVSIVDPDTEAAAQDEQEKMQTPRGRRVSIHPEVEEAIQMAPWRYDHQHPAKVTDDRPISVTASEESIASIPSPQRRRLNSSVSVESEEPEKVVPEKSPDILMTPPGKVYERPEGEEEEGVKRVSIDKKFVSWIEERPAMLRIGMSQGLGWEYPLSRTEKQELLMLHLAAENTVLSTWSP